MLGLSGRDAGLWREQERGSSLRASRQARLQKEHDDAQLSALTCETGVADVVQECVERMGIAVKSVKADGTGMLRVDRTHNIAHACRLALVGRDGPFHRTIRKIVDSRDADSIILLISPTPRQIIEAVRDWPLNNRVRIVAGRQPQDAKLFHSAPPGTVPLAARALLRDHANYLLGGVETDMVVSSLSSWRKLRPARALHRVAVSIGEDVEQHLDENELSTFIHDSGAVHCSHYWQVHCLSYLRAGNDPQFVQEHGYAAAIDAHNQLVVRLCDMAGAVGPTWTVADGGKQLCKRIGTVSHAECDWIIPHRVLREMKAGCGAREFWIAYAPLPNTVGRVPALFNDQVLFVRVEMPAWAGLDDALRYQGSFWVPAAVMRRLSEYTPAAMESDDQVAIQKVDAFFRMSKAVVRLTGAGARGLWEALPMAHRHMLSVITVRHGRQVLRECVRQVAIKPIEGYLETAQLKLRQGLGGLVRKFIDAMSNGLATQQLLKDMRMTDDDAWGRFYTPACEGYATTVPIGATPGIPVGVPTVAGPTRIFRGKPGTGGGLREIETGTMSGVSQKLRTQLDATWLDSMLASRAVDMPAPFEAAAVEARAIVSSDNNCLWAVVAALGFTHADLRAMGLHGKLAGYATNDMCDKVLRAVGRKLADKGGLAIVRSENQKQSLEVLGGDACNVAVIKNGHVSLVGLDPRVTAVEFNNCGYTRGQLWGIWRTLPLPPITDDEGFDRECELRLTAAAYRAQCIYRKKFNKKPPEREVHVHQLNDVAGARDALERLLFDTLGEPRFRADPASKILEAADGLGADCSRSATVLMLGEAPGDAAVALASQRGCRVFATSSEQGREFSVQAKQVATCHYVDASEAYADRVMICERVPTTVICDASQGHVHTAAGEVHFARLLAKLCSAAARGQPVIAKAYLPSQSALNSRYGELVLSRRLCKPRSSHACNREVYLSTAEQSLSDFTAASQLYVDQCEALTMQLVATIAFDKAHELLQEARKAHARLIGDASFDEATSASEHTDDGDPGSDGDGDGRAPDDGAPPDGTGPPDAADDGAGAELGGAPGGAESSGAGGPNTSTSLKPPVGDAGEASGGSDVMSNQLPAWAEPAIMKMREVHCEELVITGPRGPLKVDQAAASAFFANIAKEFKGTKFKGLAPSFEALSRMTIPSELPHEDVMFFHGAPGLMKSTAMRQTAYGSALVVVPTKRLAEAWREAIAKAKAAGLYVSRWPVVVTMDAAVVMLTSGKGQKFEYVIIDEATSVNMYKAVAYKMLLPTAKLMFLFDMLQVGALEVTFAPSLTLQQAWGWDWVDSASAAYSNKTMRMDATIAAPASSMLVAVGLPPLVAGGTREGTLLKVAFDDDEPGAVRMVKAIADAIGKGARCVMSKHHNDFVALSTKLLDESLLTQVEYDVLLKEGTVVVGPPAARVTYITLHKEQGHDCEKAVLVHWPVDPDGKYANRPGKLKQRKRVNGNEFEFDSWYFVGMSRAYGQLTVLTTHKGRVALEVICPDMNRGSFQNGRELVHATGSEFVRELRVEAIPSGPENGLRGAYWLSTNETSGVVPADVVESFGPVAPDLYLQPLPDDATLAAEFRNDRSGGVKVRAPLLRDVAELLPLAMETIDANAIMEPGMHLGTIEHPLDRTIKAVRFDGEMACAPGKDVQCRKLFNAQYTQDHRASDGNLSTATEVKRFGMREVARVLDAMFDSEMHKLAKQAAWKVFSEQMSVSPCPAPDIESLVNAVLRTLFAQTQKQGSAFERMNMDDFFRDPRLYFENLKTQNKKGVSYTQEKVVEALVRDGYDERRAAEIVAELVVAGNNWITDESDGPAVYSATQKTGQPVCASMAAWVVAMALHVRHWEEELRSAYKNTIYESAGFKKGAREVAEAASQLLGDVSVPPGAKVYLTDTVGMDNTYSVFNAMLFCELKLLVDGVRYGPTEARHQYNAHAAFLHFVMGRTAVLNPRTGFTASADYIMPSGLGKTLYGNGTSQSGYFAVAYPDLEVLMAWKQGDNKDALCVGDPTFSPELKARLNVEFTVSCREPDVPFEFCSALVWLGHGLFPMLPRLAGKIASKQYPVNFHDFSVVHTDNKLAAADQAVLFDTEHLYAAAIAANVIEGRGLYGEEQVRVCADSVLAVARSSARDAYRQSMRVTVRHGASSETTQTYKSVTKNAVRGKKPFLRFTEGYDYA